MVTVRTVVVPRVHAPGPVQWVLQWHYSGSYSGIQWDYSGHTGHLRVTPLKTRKMAKLSVFHEISSKSSKKMAKLSIFHEISSKSSKKWSPKAHVCARCRSELWANQLVSRSLTKSGFYVRVYRQNPGFLDKIRK